MLILKRVLPVYIFQVRVNQQLWTSMLELNAGFVYWRGRETSPS